MLQQTTVAAIVPRFERFLAKFPDVQSLAAADEQSVLKEWEGLGYYSRARNLKRAASLLVETHGGNLPNDPSVWLTLPGVGRYILGAVLSQAFDRRMPIVEANTKRVLCRLFGQTGDPKSPVVERWLWQSAEAILPRRRVGDFNQALMELGAVVCTPKLPACSACPLRGECQAFATGRQDSIPVRSSRPNVESVRETCVVIRQGEFVLLVRRPASGRWANMWEFPRLVLQADESNEDGARRLLRDLGQKAGLGAEMMTIRYAVTRFRMSMACFVANAAKQSFRNGYYEEGRWLRKAELSGFPVSTPQRALIAAVQKQAGSTIRN
jgi:A/G-specific adenine glycosylase